MHKKKYIYEVDRHEYVEYIQEENLNAPVLLLSIKTDLPWIWKTPRGGGWIGVSANLEYKLQNYVR